MDIELIKEDVKFPLHFDGLSYIWDVENNMIAMFVSDEKREIGDEIMNKLNEFAKNNFQFKSSTNLYDSYQDELVRKNKKPFILIRGWGRLQYKDNASQRFKNVLQMFLNGLNSA